LLQNILAARDQETAANFFRFIKDLKRAFLRKYGPVLNKNAALIM
jgi:hypothetical protein